MCGNPCTIDESTSTADADTDTVTCTTHTFVTAYYASSYKVVTPDILHDGAWTGTVDSEEELAKLIEIFQQTVELI